MFPSGEELFQITKGKQLPATFIKTERSFVNGRSPLSGYRIRLVFWLSVTI